jgi:hypothetical protein
MMDLDEVKGRALQQELDASGSKCIFMKSDVTDEADVSKLEC